MFVVTPPAVNPFSRFLKKAAETTSDPLSSKYDQLFAEIYPKTTNESLLMTANSVPATPVAERPNTWSFAPDFIVTGPPKAFIIIESFITGEAGNVISQDVLCETISVLDAAVWEAPSIETTAAEGTIGSPLSDISKAALACSALAASTIEAPVTPIFNVEMCLLMDLCFLDLFYYNATIVGTPAEVR
jgi:hypothetical protein